MIVGLAFYLFAAVLLAAAAMVVLSRNPVHSVLYLILAFFNAAALFLIAGAELLAMTLVIVYVGAVAVLFLFVVMMLDIDFARLREGFQRYAPIGAVVGGILFLELLLVLGTWQFASEATALRAAPIQQGGLTNTLHGLRLPFPASGHDSAGGDDRCHCADTSPATRHTASVSGRTGGTQQYDQPGEGPGRCRRESAEYPASSRAGAGAAATRARSPWAGPWGASLRWKSAWPIT